MPDIKVVMMAGYWTAWLDRLAAVSPRVNAVAARSPEDLMREIVDAEVVYGRLPREPFLAARKLKWVQSIGVGFETMLYPEMVESDVTITNTSGAFDAAMGEHALALILGFTRGIAAHDRFRKGRVWSREKVEVSLIHEQTACVLGMGTIGRSIARLLHHFGMHVIGVDAQVKAAPEGVDRLVGPDGMRAAAAEADVVVVALPVTRETQGLVDAAWFATMKSTALIVNVARGPIVNEKDLVAALTSGQIGGAALDVYEKEPLPSDSPLWDLPNVVMTPHIASRSEEGDRNLQKIFAENLRRYVSGEPLLNVVDKRKGYVVQQS